MLSKARSWCGDCAATVRGWFTDKSLVAQLLYIVALIIALSIVGIAFKTYAILIIAVVVIFLALYLVYLAVLWMIRRMK